MEEIQSKPYMEGDVQGSTWYREFELDKNLDSNCLSHLVKLALVEFKHHDMRICFENGTFEQLLNVDHKGTVHYSKSRQDSEDQEIGAYLRHVFPTTNGAVPAGKKLYIEATGICKDTEEDAQALVESWVHYMRDFYNLVPMGDK